MDAGKLLVQGALYGGVWQKISETKIGDDVFTKLLMHFNGPNNATAIVDSSINGRVITQVGIATTTSLASKVSRSSLSSGAGSGYFTLPASSDWFLNTDNFTIDFWVYWSSGAGGNTSFVGTWSGAKGWSIFWNTTWGLVFMSYDTGGTYRVYFSTTPMWTPVNNTWYHIAIVRNGTTQSDWYAFINGTAQTLVDQGGLGWAGPVVDSASTFNIGHEGLSGFYLAGYMDEVRVSHGIARWTANFTPQTTPYTADAQTVLLIHGEPHDTSAYLNIPTFVSGAKISKSPVYRFGTGSLLLNGSTDYITFPDHADWQLGGGTGDFTIDCWVRFTTLGENLYFMYCQYQDGNNRIHFHVDNRAGINHLAFGSYSGGVALSVYCTWLPTVNTWYHVAVVRSGVTTFYMFINGVSQTLTTANVGNTIPDLSALLYIGTYDAASYWFPGYIDEMRMSNSARWTANFTPQSTAYTSDANTKLLLHFDGDYTDYSGSAHGNATLVSGAKETSLWKFGTGSMLFASGSSQYASAPTSEDWGFGTGDFTVEFWYKPLTIGASQRVVEQYQNSNNQWVVSVDSNNKLSLYAAVSSVTVASFKTTSAIPSYAANTWYHMAVVRGASVCYMFVNGVSLPVTVTTAFGSLSGIAGSLYIGGDPSSGEYTNGYVDEVRVSKFARWTSGFTPSSTAYTADSYTMLLLHGDLNFKDSSLQSDHDLTAVGTATIGAVGSLKLNGSSDYLTLADSADWTFGAGDFTVEFWFNPASLNALNNMWVIGQWNSAASNRAWSVFLAGDASHITGLYFYYTTDGSTTTSATFALSPALSIGTWYHFAVVRKGTTVYAFQNGAAIGTPYTIGTATIYDSTNALMIGNYNGGSAYAYGYLDDVRVSKGLGRWTSAFTPQTTPYTVDGSTVLLLHFDGAAGNTIYDDTGKTVTVGSTAAIVTSPYQVSTIKKIGTSALYLDGNSDWLTSPDSSDFTLGKKQFTIEAWAYFNAFPTSTNYATIVSHWQGNGLNQKGWALYLYNNSGSYEWAWQASSDGSTSTDNVHFVSTGVSLGQWYHIAITRDATNLNVFMNGVRQGAATAYSTVIFDCTALLGIGATNVSPGGTPDTIFNGYLDEVRISLGIVRYTANFTPQTTAFTWDPSTVFLAHMDDLTDSSQLGHTVTPAAGASITANGVFSESSLLLNGSSDYLTVPDSNQWYLGTNNFTIDFWVKFSAALSTYTYFVSQGSSSVDMWNIRWSSAEGNVLIWNVEASSATVVLIKCPWIPVPGKWYHIALVRSGIAAGQTVFYIDGTAQSMTLSSGSWAYNVADISALLYIGAKSDPNYYVPGNLAELRITKGMAKWTQSFTPPTTAYTDDTGKALTSVSITGLNGDTDVQYRLIVRDVNGYAGSKNLSLLLNNDAGANYGYQTLYGQSTTAGASRSTGQTALALPGGSAIDSLQMTDLLLHAKSGYIRTAVWRYVNGVAGTTVNDIDLLGGVWNNTTDNITSLTLVSSQNLGLGVGSSIELYARRG